MLLLPVLRQNLRVLSTAMRSEDLQVLTGLIGAGRVTPAIDRTVPLVDAASPSSASAPIRFAEGRDHAPIGALSSDLSPSRPGPSTSPVRNTASQSALASLWAAIQARSNPPTSAKVDIP
jgi:hypothetical protein